MKIEFDTKKYVKDLIKSKSYFHTFLNRKNLSVGVLRLAPGQEDTQDPHTNDEVYYVVKGDGFLKVGDKNYAVSAGMSYFVAKNIEHHFYRNTEDLVAVYFFSGPDS